MQFLQTISTLSKAARDEGFSQELKQFYHQFQVAENIQVRGHPAALGKGASCQAPAHWEDTQGPCRGMAGTSMHGQTLSCLRGRGCC